MTIRLGTTLPPLERGPEVTEAARVVEELGLESLWVPDLLVGDGTPALEATLTLAAAAAVTERVRVGFSVLVVPLRPAPWLATQVATLQHLSHGRLELGVGVGGFPDTPFWRAVGVSGRDRGKAMDATLELLPRLLAGEPVEVVAGEPPVTLAPAAAMPPVHVGSMPRSVHRVLDRGDGWFPSLVPPDDLARAASELRELAEERGMPRPTVTVGGHIVLGDDPEARTVYDSLVDNLVTVHGMPPDAAAKVPMRARTREELADVFAAYQDAGADRVVATPDNGDWAEQLSRVAEAHAMLT